MFRLFRLVKWQTSQLSLGTMLGTARPSGPLVYFNDFISNIQRVGLYHEGGHPVVGNVEGVGRERKWKICELFADVQSLVKTSSMTEHGACKFIAAHRGISGRFDAVGDQNVFGLAQCGYAHPGEFGQIIPAETRTNATKAGLSSMCDFPVGDPLSKRVIYMK